MRPLIAIIALLLCSSTALAELTVTVKPAQTVVTVTPEIITQLETVDGDKIGDAIREVGPAVVQPAVPAAVLTVKSDRDLKKSLVRIKCPTADVLKIEQGVYVVAKAGTHTISVNVISEAPLQWDDETVTVTVGTPEPKPDPVPDIPLDRFDNLGQRVGQWSATVVDRKPIAAVYLAHAAMLRSDPSKTINDVSNSLVRSLVGLAGHDGLLDVRKNIQADLSQRWSRDQLGRIDLADYYSAVATGLGGVQ